MKLNIKMTPAGSISVTYSDVGFDESFLFSSGNVFESSNVDEDIERKDVTVFEKRDVKEDDFFYYSVNV